jgi:hypothetical protein
MYEGLIVSGVEQKARVPLRKQEILVLDAFKGNLKPGK